MERYPALLLGPTGSGKTPLGDCIDRHGWNGYACVHFDFGGNLRQAAQAAGRNSAFDPLELEIIRRSLATGALLEDGHFSIAEKLFRTFARERGVRPDACIILNGLPRHVGQARDCERLFDIRRLIHLRCTPGVVYERIRRDSGGDRAGRIDDTPAEIRKKLRVFEKQTRPLIEYSAERQIPLQPITVRAGTTPTDAYRRIVR